VSHLFRQAQKPARVEELEHVDLQVTFPDGSISLVPAYAAVEVARRLWHRFGQPGAITAAALIEDGMREPEGTAGITLDQPQADAVCSVLDSAQHLRAAFERQ
jgi:hypothetical protein